MIDTEQVTIGAVMPASTSDQSNIPPSLFCATSTATMTKKVVTDEITSIGQIDTPMNNPPNSITKKISAPNLAWIWRLLA